VLGSASRCVAQLWPVKDGPGSLHGETGRAEDLHISGIELVHVLFNVVFYNSVKAFCIIIC